MVAIKNIFKFGQFSQELPPGKVFSPAIANNFRFSSPKLLFVGAAVETSVRFLVLKLSIFLVHSTQIV
jgi:hypothetical protein